MVLIGISFFLVSGGATAGTLNQYLNIYYINGGRIADASVIGGWISSATFITGILTIPFWTWMGEKFDKKTVLGVLLAGTIFGHFLNIVCVRPGMPYLQLIPSIFGSMANSAIWLFRPSMKGDVADFDEVHSTRRREGSSMLFTRGLSRLLLPLPPGLEDC
jgi:GPH family glycoside/pentoside/hexuronide:cation symporter